VNIEEFIFEEVKKVTVSIGIAVYKESEVIEKSINRADKCLYSSKKNGKNRVTYSTT
jgi:diguanylate cyclase (GGDEF)-like protein